MSLAFGNFINVKMHFFLLLLFPSTRYMPDLRASRGSGRDLRTLLGHPQPFQSIGVSAMSLAQESEVSLKKCFVYIWPQYVSLDSHVVDFFFLGGGERFLA